MYQGRLQLSSQQSVVRLLFELSVVESESLDQETIKAFEIYLSPFNLNHLFFYEPREQWPTIGDVREYFLWLIREKYPEADSVFSDEQWILPQVLADVRVGWLTKSILPQMNDQAHLFLCWCQLLDFFYEGYQTRGEESFNLCVTIYPLARYRAIVKLLDPQLEKDDLEKMINDYLINNDVFIDFKEALLKFARARIQLLESLIEKFEESSLRSINGPAILQSSNRSQLLAACQIPDFLNAERLAIILDTLNPSDWKSFFEEAELYSELGSFTEFSNSPQNIIDFFNKIYPGNWSAVMSLPGVGDKLKNALLEESALLDVLDGISDSRKIKFLCEPEITALVPEIVKDSLDDFFDIVRLILNVHPDDIWEFLYRPVIVDHYDVMIKDHDDLMRMIILFKNSHERFFMLPTIKMKIISSIENGNFDKILVKASAVGKEQLTRMMSQEMDLDKILNSAISVCHFIIYAPKDEKMEFLLSELGMKKVREHVHGAFLLGLILHVSVLLEQDPALHLFALKNGWEKPFNVISKALHYGVNCATARNLYEPIAREDFAIYFPSANEFSNEFMMADVFINTFHFDHGASFFNTPGARKMLDDYLDSYEILHKTISSLKSDLRLSMIKIDLLSDKLVRWVSTFNQYREIALLVDSREFYELDALKPLLNKFSKEDSERCVPFLFTKTLLTECPFVIAIFDAYFSSDDPRIFISCLPFLSDQEMVSSFLNAKFVKDNMGNIFRNHSQMAALFGLFTDNHCLWVTLSKNQPLLDLFAGFVEKYDCENLFKHLDTTTPSIKHSAKIIHECLVDAYHRKDNRAQGSSYSYERLSHISSPQLDDRTFFINLTRLIKSEQAVALLP